MLPNCGVCVPSPSNPSPLLRVCSRTPRKRPLRWVRPHPRNPVPLRRVCSRTPRNRLPLRWGAPASAHPASSPAGEFARPAHPASSPAGEFAHPAHLVPLRRGVPAPERASSSSAGWSGPVPPRRVCSRTPRNPLPLRRVCLRTPEPWFMFRCSPSEPTTAPSPSFAKVCGELRAYRRILRQVGGVGLPRASNMV